MAGYIPDNYEEKEMSDVDFAKWCRSKGWEGDYTHLNNTGNIVYTAYTVGNKTIAIVKIKNNAPIDRWLFLNPDA